MAGNYALVLTGEVLPGFAPETVWPQLAAYFRMEPEKMAQLVAHAPRTVKQDGDLGKLQTMQASMAQAGAKAEICIPDERPALYVLIGDAPRGPIPRVLAEQRVQQGVWADAVSVAEVGSREWKPYRELAAAAAPQSAAAPTVWAAPAAPVALDAAHPMTAAARYGGEEDAGWGTLPTGDAIHAGFWRRCAAYAIDNLILLIPSLILSLVPLLGPILNLIIQWLYFALQESSALQATLGKRAMGIKVTDEHGRRIQFGRATGRYFGKIVSGMIFCVGFMLAGWTERKQALHDMMATTFVVFDAVQPTRPLPVQRPPMPWYGWVLNILQCLAPVAVMGIVAAIALPAYRDFTVRAQVMDAITAAAPVEQEVASQGCQAGSRAATNPRIEKIEVAGDTGGACSIGVTFAQGQNVAQPLRGATIAFDQDEDGKWTCSSDSVPSGYLRACSAK